MFQKQKEIFHLAVPQDLFFPEWAFSGGKVVYKCYLYFRGKSDWRIVDSLSLELGRGSSLSNKQDSASGVGGMSKLKTTGISCVGLLGCGVVARVSSWPWKSESRGNSYALLLSFDRETLAQMIEENLNCLGHLSTIIHEANEKQGNSMMVSFIWIWMCFGVCWVQRA